jgi:NAD(P)-dependent dehydrogenase (short-subunit alcohol dehydrogenase family)
MAAAASRAVLVTGCSTGIGRATAARLRAAGHDVVATARRVETLADLERAGCRTLALDVTDEESMRAAVEQAGPLYALVNNAGYSQSGPVEEVPLEAARRQFETNVFGAMRMAQLVLPGMRERREGRIVNISSMGAHFVFPGGGWYHATKHALDALTDALRFEVAGFGVKVVSIQPGLIKTEFASAATSSMEGATSAEGPYGAFNAGLSKSTKAVYENPVMLRLGGGPDAVAKVVEKAIASRRPKARYLVTPSAHLLVTQRRLMTDGMWDRMMRTQFRQPK